MNLDPNKIYVVITYGQSNSLGIANVSDANDPILNPSTTSKNYKVEWDWTNSVFTLSENKQIVHSINDNDWNRISPSYYSVEGLDKRLNDSGLPNPVFVNIAAGRNALAIASLAKNTTQYNKLKSSVQFVVDSFPTKQVEVLFISWIHGESDSYIQANVDAYQAALIQLKNDLNTDLATITGQSSRFRFYLDQISWGIPGQGFDIEIQTKMREVQRHLTETDSELIYTMPTYQLATATQDPSKPASDIHFSGYSLLQLGEIIADTYFKKEILGKSIDTLNKFFIQRIASDKIVIKIDTQSNLSIDSTIPTYNNQQGFTYSSESIEMEIDKVETIKNNIILKFKSDVNSGILYYVHTYPFTINSILHKRPTGSIKSNITISSKLYNKVFYYYLPSFLQIINI